MIGLSNYVRSVLLECPAISKDSPDMCIDFLGTEIMSYSVESLPVDPVIKRYFGGSTHRRFVCALTAQYAADNDVLRIENQAHYEELTAWIDDQTRMRKLPDMGDGAQIKSLKTIGNPYVLQRDEDGITAIYSMQIELEYHQKVRT